MQIIEVPPVQTEKAMLAVSLNIFIYRYNNTVMHSIIYIFYK